MLNIIGTLIFGLVIGVLARIFMKGRQKLSITATMLLGAGGVIAGNLILQAAGYPVNTAGIDWIRWVVCTFCAVGAISFYLGFTAKK